MNHDKIIFISCLILHSFLFYISLVFMYRGGHKSLYPVQLLLFELGKVTYGHPCIYPIEFSLVLHSSFIAEA